MPSGSPEASCSGSADMPRAGIVASPVENMRNTKRKKREVVAKSDSKKTPPRKGRKNFSTKRAEKPRSCR